MMVRTVSVVVPTRGRSEKLATCLECVARQALPDGVTLEVFVVFDGDEDGAAAFDAAALNARFQILSIPASGAAAARNAAIANARGELLIFLNDDCYPSDGWLMAHLNAQRSMPDGGMCVGRTDWRQWPDETVFDALVRETPMVFFEAEMIDGEDYGFRHFWTCNTSVPADAVKAVGGFDERLRPVFFEDVELGFRLSVAGVAGVRYVRDAKCVHDHRLTWDEYLQREKALGRMAVLLQQANPDCFRAIFGYGSLTAMAQDCEAWLRLNEREATRAAGELSRQMSRLRAEAEDWQTLRELLYLAHLPVKRAAFRRALMATVAEQSGRSDSQESDRGGEMRRVANMVT